MMQTIGRSKRGFVMFCSGSPSMRRASCRKVLVFLLATIWIAHSSWAQCATASDSTHCSPWVATWGTAMQEAFNGSAPNVTGQTLRLIVHTSVGGSGTRIWLSNRFGVEPIRIGSAHIAVSVDPGTNTTPAANLDQSAIKPETDRALTFNGDTSVTIPPGATIVSDPATLDVPALANLAVSLYFPDPTLASTVHGGANQSSYLATGDATGAPDLTGKSWTRNSWYFLTGVDVDAPGASAVATLGDSITDGNHSTLNANRRWPDDLAVRLAQNPATRKAGVLGVVNVGTSGSRLLLDGDGPNAMARLNWDVLDRSGVRYLILFEGINDIEAQTRVHQPYDELVKQLEWGLAQIATQAHDRGIKVFVATQMTDCHDFHCTWPEGEKARTAFNEWTRASKLFDGLIDFDLIMRDPQHPTQMLQQYNSGDFVHPNDTGYQAMADAIDLGLFTSDAPSAQGRGNSVSH
jgi:lysophospholipase L1-like esterase